jgi:tRNA G18 (ribose-2'-O)-methylase SpoU
MPARPADKMAGMEHVTDPADPRLAEYVDLNDPDLRRRVEGAGAFFIAESPHVVEIVLQAGRRVRSVLATAKQYAALERVLAGVDAPVYVAPEAVLRRVVGFDLHRGIVASVDRWPLPPPRAVLDGATRVVGVERVNDHENLGVLFRSAAALGVDAVVLDASSVDPLYRRCVRVSIGQVCTLPWTRVDSFETVRAAGLELVALTPAPGATPLPEFRWPARTALLLGAEGTGLRDATLAAADHRVRIPMRFGVDSLNVATAGAIACYAAGPGVGATEGWRHGRDGVTRDPC